jgi:hypothetical protein
MDGDERTPEQQTEQTPGQRAVALALSEWQRMISARPECYQRISEYLRAAGEHRPYPAPQVDGKPYQWCGAFAAWAWINGAGLHPDLGSSWASTYRLARLYGQYGQDRNLPTPSLVVGPGGELLPLREYHAAHGGQRVCLAARKPLDGVQVGDVALVGQGAWGGHVTLVLGLLADGSGISTVSGNGYGYWPASYTEPLSTRKVRGVVVADVPWASVAYVIRPAPADLDRELILRRGAR